MARWSLGGHVTTQLSNNRLRSQCTKVQNVRSVKGPGEKDLRGTRVHTPPTAGAATSIIFAFFVYSYILCMEYISENMLT